MNSKKENIDLEYIDIFNRNIQIENIYTMIKNNDKGFVAAIDSAFGMGKTTFLKFFKLKLDNEIKKGEKIISIYYDAWENDFFNNPFISLLSCFNIELEKSDHVKKSDITSAITRIGNNVVSFVTGGIINPFELLEDMASNENRTLIAQYNKLLDERSSIYKLFESLSKSELKDENYKVVFFIDELDRCKPSFALSLLEIIKHFFTLPNYYFIIPMHKEQIASTIKLKYGSQIDSMGYLRRFIDFDIILNPISIKKYIEFHSSEYIQIHTDYVELFNMLSIIADNSKLSLRDIDKIFLILNLILPKDWLLKRMKIQRQTEMIETVFEMHLLSLLLVLKLNEPVIYRNFINKSLILDSNMIQHFKTLTFASDKTYTEFNISTINHYRDVSSLAPQFSDALILFYNCYKNRISVSEEIFYNFSNFQINFSNLFYTIDLELDVIKKIQISDDIN